MKEISLIPFRAIHFLVPLDYWFIITVRKWTRTRGTTQRDWLDTSDGPVAMLAADIVKLDLVVIHKPGVEDPFDLEDVVRRGGPDMLARAIRRREPPVAPPRPVQKIHQEVSNGLPQGAIDAMVPVVARTDRGQHRNLAPRATRPLRFTMLL